MTSKQATKTCPHCGKGRLVYPDIKGQYGWKDTHNYLCLDCLKTFPKDEAIIAAPKGV